MKNIGVVIISLSVLIIALSIGYYFLIFLPKKENLQLGKEGLLLAQKEEVKTKNQESFDTCISREEYEFKREFRNSCWVYNHDAIDCDLSYFESYKIGDTPQTKFKNAVKNCEEKHPVADRLYSSTSPDYQSSLTPLGNISEREAVKRVLGLDEFKVFLSTLGEGYKITYSIAEPTKDKPYWFINLYKYTGSGEEITLSYFAIDAMTGKLSVLGKQFNDSSTNFIKLL